jgi:hypothetical protein
VIWCVFTFIGTRNKAVHHSPLIVNLGVDAERICPLDTSAGKFCLRLDTADKSNRQDQESALWIFTHWEVSAGGSNEIILSRQPRDYENGLRALQAQCSVITTGKVTSAGEKQTRTARGERMPLRASHITPESFHALRTFSLGEVNSLTFKLCE